MFGKKVSPSAGVGLGIGAPLLTRIQTTPDASEIVDESGLKNSVEEFWQRSNYWYWYGSSKGLASAEKHQKR